MSGLVTSPNFKQRIFGSQTPSSGISGCVVAIYEIGAFVGALSVMIFGKPIHSLFRPCANIHVIGQKLGRRKTTALGQIITIIGAVLQATSYNLGQMIAARVITGGGVGLLTATVPVWTVRDLTKTI